MAVFERWHDQADGQPLARLRGILLRGFVPARQASLHHFQHFLLVFCRVDSFYRAGRDKSERFLVGGFAIGCIVGIISGFMPVSAQSNGELASTVAFFVSFVSSLTIASKVAAGTRLDRDDGCSLLINPPKSWAYLGELERSPSCPSLRSRWLKNSVSPQNRACGLSCRCKLPQSNVCHSSRKDKWAKGPLGFVPGSSH